MYTIGQPKLNNLDSLLARLYSEVGFVNDYAFRLLFPALTLTASTQLFQSLPPKLSKRMREFEAQERELLQKLMEAHNLVGYGISKKALNELLPILFNIETTLNGWKNSAVVLRREALEIIEEINPLERQEEILQVLRNAWKMTAEALEYLSDSVLRIVINTLDQTIELVH